MDRRAAVIRYDAVLVEEAVLAALRRSSAGTQREFHARRSPVYERPEPEEREACFEALHAEWFTRLGLDAPLHQALQERPEVLRAVGECRVWPARSRRAELADLAEAARGPDERILLVRVRPDSLAESRRLLGWLRHELLHVTDMLDPRYGYRPRLPHAQDGVLLDSLLRERYRVVWDVTVGGRLLRERREAASVRDRLWPEFQRAFSMLGGQAEASFDRWFRETAPSHATIAEFVRDPRLAAGAVAGGRA
jgi:hypothetical protein